MRAHRFLAAALVAAAACTASDGSPGEPGDGGGGPGDPDAGGAGLADARRDDAADATTPLGEPTWSHQFATQGEGDAWHLRQPPGGSIDFGVADPGAEDGLVARLVFPGVPALGPGDRLGPAFATEVATAATFDHGTFRTRVQLAACQPGEEVVNGLFTYFNDGTDHDADGIDDNHEIDIEILCGTPTVIFLSTWTDYEDATGAFRKWTRAINLADGTLWESPSDHEYGLVAAGQDPALVRPGFPDPDAYYELGFEWGPEAMRFFLVDQGTELTLWDHQDARYIPAIPGPWMWNVWHPGEHWFGGGAAPDYPANDAILRIDWARYWAR